MWTNRRGAIAGGAILAALAVALLAVSADDEGPTDIPSVLGVQFNESTSSTTSTTAASETTTTSAEPASTTTTAAPAAATTTTARATAPVATAPPGTAQTVTTTPPSGAPERVLESSDNGGTFTYQPGQPSTAGASPPTNAVGDRFRFLVSIDPPESDNGVATVRVEMRNESGRQVVFPEGGLLIRVFLTKDDDGQQRVVEIRRPEIGGLAVRESLELFQQYITDPGTYHFRAEAPVEYRD